MKKFEIMVVLNDGKSFTIVVEHINKDRASAFVAELFSNYSKLSGHRYTVLSETVLYK